MTTKHTPGKWRYQLWEDGTCSIFLNDACIAEVKNEAITKVMVTAYELLEIAEKCLHWCNCAESFEFVKSLRIKAEKAIKKATE